MNGDVLCCDIYGKEGKAYKPFSVFEKMWMEFPTPFHAGDPVYAPTSGVWKPFVLTDISTWDSERIRQELPPTVYSEDFLFFGISSWLVAESLAAVTPWQEVIPWGCHHKTRSSICIATIFPFAIIGSRSITSSPSAAPSAFCGRSATT